MPTEGNVGPGQWGTNIIKTPPNIFEGTLGKGSNGGVGTAGLPLYNRLLCDVLLGAPRLLKEYKSKSAKPILVGAFEGTFLFGHKLMRTTLKTTMSHGKT
jgi:hypothetical protein